MANEEKREIYVVVLLTDPTRVYATAPGKFDALVIAPVPREAEFDFDDEELRAWVERSVRRGVLHQLTPDLRDEPDDEDGKP